MRFLIAMILLLGVAQADHLPESLLAQGQAETTLCGIDIHHSRVPELLEKFGKPVAYDKYPKTEEAAEITWDKDGSNIHTTINVDQIAYAVDVKGRPTAIATTGRGLSLGQTLADLKRIDGSKFSKHGDRITLQWQNGTEMRVLFAKGRIVALTLIAAVE